MRFALAAVVLALAACEPLPSEIGSATTADVAAACDAYTQARTFYSSQRSGCFRDPDPTDPGPFTPVADDRPYSRSSCVATETDCTADDLALIAASATCLSETPSCEGDGGRWSHHFRYCLPLDRDEAGYPYGWLLSTACRKAFAVCPPGSTYLDC